MTPINGYFVIQPEDLAWRPSHMMKIPNADFLERTKSEILGARLWRLPPKSAMTLHKHPKMVVCGHTHMQFDRTIGKVRVVNAGSVGMPYGEPGAHWLLLGPDVQFRHTLYDLAKAAARIRETNYPQAEDFAARNVLQPPSEGEILEAFSKIQLGRTKG